MFFNRRPFRPDGGGDAAPCLVASRMVRDDEARWQAARSCLGGEPALERRRWPMSGGYPMHCIAQIDLAEVAAAGLPFDRLPASGSLAFFADTATMATGAVRLVPDALPEDAVAPHPRPPIYGEGWASCCPGTCDRTDVPTAFPRWPLTFTPARQRETGADRFAPPLAEIFGPKPKSTRLDVSGLVAGTWQGEHFRPEEDAAPFPARAAVLVLKDAIHAVTMLLGSGYLGVRKPAADHDAAPYVEAVSAKAEAAARAAPFLREMEAALRGAEPDAPLGPERGARFTAALLALQEVLQPHMGYLRLGRGWTATAGAAAQAWYRMYAGPRAGFEAIPEEIRAQIARERLRSAHSTEALVHQLGGHGAQIQNSDPSVAGMTLLLQVATDEVVDLHFGDGGVAQHWIAPEDLAAGHLHKAKFHVEGT